MAKTLADLKLLILEKTAAHGLTVAQTEALIERLTEHVKKGNDLASTVAGRALDLGKLGLILGAGGLVAAPMLGGYATGYMAGQGLNSADEGDIKAISDIELADEYDRLNNEFESRRRTEENKQMMARLRAKSQRSLF